MVDQMKILLLVRLVLMLLKLNMLHVLIDFIIDLLVQVNTDQLVEK